MSSDPSLTELLASYGSGGRSGRSRGERSETAASPKEAWVGVRVRVNASDRERKGQVGVVERAFGHPEYLAFEVRFADGRSSLLWHHQVLVYESRTG
jgi:hypothetical protein